MQQTNASWRSLAELGLQTALSLIDPRTAVAPMDAAPYVGCVQLPIVNLYFVATPDPADRHWTLVDAGLPFSAGRIVQAAAQRFGPRTPPQAVILTHGHFDHVGALRTLLAQWDVPVYVHPLEMPYVTGASSYPPPDPAVGGGAMAFLSRLFPRAPIDISGRVFPLPNDGTVPTMPGWRWIHTPGHTEGHVSLFREEDRTLIAGDAFVTTAQESATAVVTRRKVVHRPPAYYTTNWVLARRSIETLARLEPRVAATGHGVPMRGESLRRGLERLLRDWEDISLPEQGRYLDQPAVADDRGVVWVPPPISDPAVRTVAKVSLAAAVTTMALALWLASREKNARKSWGAADGGRS